MTEWITAEEARSRLGVRAQTLYAYVSRGRVHVRADPVDPRRSLYSAADIAALVERKGRSRRISDVAAGAIAWGEPVLESAITTIVENRLYYRGREAVRLAQTEPLEAVARLLRGGHGAALKRGERLAPPSGASPAERAFAALAARAAVDPPALGRGPLDLSLDAVRLLNAVADAMAGEAVDGPIHERLARAWARDPSGPAADLIRRALVLTADHELNASTFAARVAASTGASLAAAALAGLAALSGPRHGGAGAALRVFAEEAARRGPTAALAERFREDRPLPGFGHPLYDGPDPRAAALLAQFELPASYAALAAAVGAATNRRPNIDFALAALTEAHSLPPDAPFIIFATARTAGWIAHAIEQGRTAGLIRPRARYVGPQPEDHIAVGERG